MNRTELKKDVENAAAMVAKTDNAMTEAKVAKENEETAFLKETAPLYKQVEEIQAAIGKKREHLRTLEARYNESSSAASKARREFLRASVLKILFSGAPITDDDIKFLADRIYSWGGVNSREVKTSRPGVRVVAFTEKGDYKKDHAYYMAFKNGVLISALKVDKAQHIGDTTYTHAYGSELAVTREEYSKIKQAYSRTGYSFKEWLDPAVVKFTGLTDEEIFTKGSGEYDRPFMEAFFKNL